MKGYFEVPDVGTDTEGFMLLVGRIQALAAYVVNCSEYSIDRKIIAEMLGFDLKENHGCCGREGEEK